MGRLYLAAHAMPAVLIVWVVAVALSALTARVAIPLDLLVFEPPRDIPAAELVAVVFGATAAALTAPRMVEWEKLGGARVRASAAALVVLVTALAVAVALAGVLRLPPDTPWQFLPGNVVVCTALACVGRAVVGAAPAAGGATVLFVACCVVQNVAPGAAAWLPLSRPGADPLPIAVPLTALAIAVAVTALSHGTTMWAHSRGRD